MKGSRFHALFRSRPPGFGVEVFLAEEMQKGCWDAQHCTDFASSSSFSLLPTLKLSLLSLAMFSSYTPLITSAFLYCAGKKNNTTASRYGKQQHYFSNGLLKTNTRMCSWAGSMGWAVLLCGLPAEEAVYQGWARKPRFVKAWWLINWASS